MTDRIFLVGFMGAGKTTVGRVLAARLDWEFVDLDVEIEERERQSIAEIFARRGEPWFRLVERECLKQVATRRKRVVSLGGGAYVSPENRALVESLGVSVYLDAPLEILLERIGDEGVRPLARDRAGLERLLDERIGVYRMARLTVETGDRSPEEVVEEILREIGDL